MNAKFQSLLFVLKQSYYNLHNSTFKFTKWRNLIYTHFYNEPEENQYGKTLKHFLSSWPWENLIYKKINHPWKSAIIGSSSSSYKHWGISWVIDTSGEINFGWQKYSQEQDVSV